MIYKPIIIILILMMVAKRVSFSALAKELKKELNIVGRIRFNVGGE